MKRISVLLAALALILILPATAYAAGVTFTIDNEYKDADMDNKSYSDGYTPVSLDGGKNMTIVLPIIANGDIQGDTVTATPGLGDPSSCPFVYSNYQITTGKDATYTGEGERYIVKLELPLDSGRVKGVYPVTVEIIAEDAGGDAIQQTFTAYVTISDGKEPPSEPKPEKPASQPKIIVSDFRVDPSPVEAGGEFTAFITLQNTSTSKSVQNMSVTISCDCQSFELLDDTNTIYIGKLAKDSTADIEVRYKVDLDTQPQRYNIMLSMEYDNSNAQTFSSQGSVTVTVKQPLRVEMKTPQIPNQVNAGDTMPLSFQVMNMGRSRVYNVRIELSAPGLIPTETAFIGNMEPGTAMPGDMDVFVGTKNMTEGYDGEDKYGYTFGKIILIYEDTEGQEYTTETEFSTMINPPVIVPASAPAEEPEKASQWWISVLIGAVAIAGLAALLIIRGRKGRQHEDF